MAGTNYTTKVRAKRIELQYFKRSHPFRRWKFLLSVAAPIVAAGWLLVHAARGDQRIYTTGPLSTAHAMFNTECGQCHGPGDSGRSGLLLKVSNGACMTCHDGPVHHGNQTFEPTCASCHVEHKGRVELADMSDGFCTQCHARLTLKGGRRSAFATDVTSFGKSHPQFAPTVRDGERPMRVRLDEQAALKDPTQLSLNHAKHLQVGLEGLDAVKAATGMRGLIAAKGGLQLSCTYCHRPDEQRVSMEPVSFAEHCVGCHATELQFDPHLPPVPHVAPSIVHAFLETMFLDSFDACRALQGGRAQAKDDPGLRSRCEGLGLLAARGGGRRSGELPAARDEAPDSARGRRMGRSEAAEEEPARPRGGRERAQEPAESPGLPASGMSAREWTKGQLAAVEKLIFKQRCTKCHVLTDSGTPLPAVVPPAIPDRWFRHSVFAHGVHRSVACTECHGKAVTSKETSDLLLPGIAVCRQCHHATAGARTNCVECHPYHDRASDRDLNGALTIREMTRERR